MALGDKGFVVETVRLHTLKGGLSEPDARLQIVGMNGAEVMLELQGDCCSGTYFKAGPGEFISSLLGEKENGIE